MEALVADLQQRLLRLEEDARRKDEYIVQLEHRIAAIENSPQVSLPDETHDVIDLTDARLSVLEADDVGSAVASEHSDADIERLPLQSEDDLSEKFGLAPFIDRIPPLVRDYMRPHQRVGAAFLASVLSSNSGSVFADALGLGKTLQVLSAVHVLWCEHAVSRILIVVPSTVIPHWCDEIRSFNSLISGQGIRPFRYPTLIESTVPLDARASIVKPWAQSGGILLVSYGIFCELMNQATVRALLCDDPGAQCLILDEGHRICNAKTHNHSYLSRLPTRRRVVISGYPLQNQLRELYTLVDFVDREKCLKVLGTYKQFQTLFEVPIIKLRSKNVAKARGRSFVLYELLRNNQLFFRRDGSLLQRFLPKKTELVISIRLSSCQRELWLRFLNRRVGLDGVSMHNIATMIADHPEIARRQATSDPTAPCRDWLSDTVPDSLDITSSGKMVVLMQLILQSKAAGDKIVIFSRWVKALSFIEELIGAYNSSNASRGTIRALRFDGSTSMVERQNLIDEFMASSSTADCFLISTLCGEGISLVAANRAVLLEVNWNPSVDFQAASRVFRLGQKKPVFIYRFVMHDMFEEKVFERQLEKVELTNWVLDAADIDVDGNLDTRWSEFLKPPAPITDIVGPTAVNVPSDALRDPVTSSILQRHGMGPGDVAGDNDAKWIVSVTDHSRFFLENDHFELPGAEDVDPLLAREELEYDRVYPRGTPSRSNPEVNVTFSASARRPLSIASVDAEREGTKSAERDPQHGSVPAEALEVLFGRSSSSCESEKNLPNRTAVIDGQGHTSLSASGAIRQLEDLPERSFQSLPDSVELSAAAAEFPSNADHSSRSVSTAWSQP
ncbi:SNF2-related domain containing protein [Plasmodiophora brassicae]|uniref:Uncharacterized protein n=1 Tax=Plasmodiophora brassicae TaxID=37360 RepID=A0A0G4IIK5_PLABS|nr:hypothetical protein PBRA_003738 [Plasmodiophora brassicae]